MRRQVKSLVTAILRKFGFELSKTELLEKSDDPYHLLSLLLSPDTIELIVDGGASIGNTSARLSDLFPNSKVFAFEPYPPFIEQLRLKVAEKKNIMVMPVALDDQTGSKSLKINESAGTSSFFQASDFGREVYGRLLSQREAIEVKTTTIDDFASRHQIEKIDLLKLDLQGNELAVINGASKMLARGSIKCILSEIIFATNYVQESLSCRTIIELMGKHGFHLFNFYQPNYHKGRLLQKDALFFHESIIEEIHSKADFLFHSHSSLLKTPR